MTNYMPAFFDEIFEEKLIQTILVDHDFGKMMMEVFDPIYFDKPHTEALASVLKSYYCQYETFPSNDLIPAILDKEVSNPIILDKTKKFIKKIQSRPLNGDIDYVKEKALEFFRLQHILVTIKEEVFPRIEQGVGKVEEIVTLIEKAVNKGTDNDLGYDYINDDEERFNEENIETVPTGWDAIDKRTRGGGFGKKRLITLLAPPGAGKCFAKGTKILMYDGSIKNVEDVKIGDELMGPNSRPRNVLSTTSGKENMWRITPTKGDSWECNESHILSLVDSLTGKIHNLSIREYLKLPNYRKEKLKQYRSKCIQFSKKDLIIEPYMMGLWLGDGSKNSAAVTTADFEIENYLKEYADKFNYNFKVYTKKGNKASTFRLTKPRGVCLKENLLVREFKKAVIDNEKRILKNYLINSEKNRLEILAGLIDTDGNLSHSGFEITTKYKGLSEDILFLARSLGFAAYCSIKHNKEFNRDYYRIFISGDCSIIPTRIKRKKAEKRNQIKDVLRTGIKIENLGPGEYFGFSVAGDDSLFLLGDFTVVHNSSLAVNIGKAALFQGKTVVHYTFELDWREIAEKYDASISGVEINHLSGNKKNVLLKLKAKLPEGARLIIKEYPIRGASIQTIRNHLAKLRLQGIIPDEVIIDQGGHLKSSQPNKENRHNLSNNWIEAKRLAQTEKLPVIILHQINRTGYNEELITLDMVAECFDIIGHSDIVLTLARNLAQKKAGLGKILLGKNRQGEDGVVLAYGIDGSRALIDIFEFTDEIDAIMQEQKEEAERNENQSLAARIEKFRTKLEQKKKRNQEDE